MSVTLSSFALNTLIDDWSPRFAGGTLVLMTAEGVTVAATPLLVPSFGPAVAGVAPLRPVPDFTATAAGTVTQFEIRTAGGALLLTGDVTNPAGTGALKIAGTALVIGQIVRLGPLPLSIPASA